MFLHLTKMDGVELWLNHNIIESYRIQDCGRGTVITTENSEEILVKESSRNITNQLRRAGYTFL